MTLKQQLIRDEGLRLKIYADDLGHPTIGYGRALDTKGISRDEAEILLEHDISDACAGVDERLPWASTLDIVRQAVLQNMAFNLGISGLLGFKRMLAAVKRGDYDRAAVEMIDSRWAQQVGPRAYRLLRQMQTGEWQ